MNFLRLETRLKHRPHNWIDWSRVNRPLCVWCGLLWLRNAVSDRWARMSCPGKE